MLIDKIRASMIEATKARNEIEKNILKLVLGEVARASSQELTDKQVLGIMQGIIESNIKTMSLMKPGTEGAKNLIQENECLLKFIPKIS